MRALYRIGKKLYVPAPLKPEVPVTWLEVPFNLQVFLLTIICLNCLGYGYSAIKVPLPLWDPDLGSGKGNWELFRLIKGMGNHGGILQLSHHPPLI